MRTADRAAVPAADLLQAASTPGRHHRRAFGSEETGFGAASASNAPTGVLTAEPEHDHHPWSPTTSSATATAIAHLHDPLASEEQFRPVPAGSAHQAGDADASVIEIDREVSARRARVRKFAPIGVGAAAVLAGTMVLSLLQPGAKDPSLSNALVEDTGRQATPENAAVTGPGASAAGALDSVSQTTADRSGASAAAQEAAAEQAAAKKAAARQAATQKAASEKVAEERHEKAVAARKSESSTSSGSGSPDSSGSSQGGSRTATVKTDDSPKKSSSTQGSPKKQDSSSGSPTSEESPKSQGSGKSSQGSGTSEGAGKSEGATKTEGSSNPVAHAAQVAGEGVQAAIAQGWKAIGGDEFTGSSLGENWSAYDGEGHAGNGRRSPDAVSVENGNLTIKGDSNGKTGGIAWGKSQKYGKWEMRARFPEGDKQYHPVLLLWPSEVSWPEGGEIDFAETNSAAKDVSFFLHHGSDNSQESDKKAVDITQWHNYAVEWTPDAIVGYIDGKEFFRNTDKNAQPPGPMHATIQLDYFPDGGSPKPSEMNVAWMRQYS
ncbi:glycoside hydrolase family 16 protein [Pseudonocardia phyllosphaerae]|uniref:glycoside hydrolase family 16 protein n=1 Tax=Pseudonocardia phyllosphaerae TaxID=3390502 RepID=UPI00397CDF55